VLALDPENPEAHLELGILHERRGQMERAEEHFVESLKADPANPRALYSYASLYYTADDLEVAEEILERAIAADARYSPALSALASIQARRGEYGDALDYIEKAVDAGESDIEHFRSALEFAPLHADPRFRTLLSRMVRGESNGQG
jgi:Flp pilus assembly protein TadD